MKIEFRGGSLEQLTSSALVAYAFEGSPAASGSVGRLPAESRRLLGELEATRELSGKTLECTLIHRPPGLEAARLLVVGAGKEEKFSGAVERRLAGTAVRFLRSRGVRDLAWVVAGKGGESQGVQAVVEGALLGDYDSDRYKTERDGRRAVERFDLVLSGPPDPGGRGRPRTRPRGGRSPELYARSGE